MKSKIWYNLKQILIILGAALAAAVSIELLLLPSNVVVGGASGIASILDILLTNTNSAKWYFSVGVWVVAVNIPILIYTFVRFRKRFAVKTLLYVVFLAAFLLVFRICNLAEIFKKAMVAEGEDIDKVLYVVIGGALHGVSLPMILSVNASTGGSDVVGLIVQRHSKKSSSDAMRLILATNIVILLASSLSYYFVRGDSIEAINMFIYSVAAMFIGEIVQELIFKGFSAAVELEVTTEKPLEMAQALQNELKHGTTSVKVVGGYSHQERDMIICIVNKSQLPRARRVISEVDPGAFAYVENVKEVIGRGFANKEIELEDNK